MADQPSKSSIALESRESAAGKLYSPSAARNSSAIVEVLKPRLVEGAGVLEIGSGTGEHAEAVCRSRPDIRWTPTDPDPQSRASQATRANEIGSALQPPHNVDAAQDGWWTGFDAVDALISCNVVHIAPWAVAEGIARGGTKLVKPTGFVMLYGPFLTGAETADSNLAFDANLKARNQEWGVRSLDAVTELFLRHSFRLEEKIDMPANNLSLIYRRCPT